MNIIDWMMAYPYLSAFIIITGLLFLSTKLSIEIKMGNPNKETPKISDSSKKDKKGDKEA